MIRSALVVAVAGAVVSAAPDRAPTAVGMAPVAAVRYAAPLPAPLRVLRGFDPPLTRYGAGHLGVDLRAGPHAIVRAAGAGSVRFAGDVAGRGVVVLVHADGVSTEYEPIRPVVAAGALVRAGDVLGRLAGVHPGCPARWCLHWGARRDGHYLDPLALLRRLGPVRLLPWPRDGPHEGWRA